MKRFIIQILSTSISFYILTKLFSSISFGSTYAIILMAIVFTIAHKLLKPLLQALRRPISIISLGFISFPVNGLIMLISANLVDGAYISSLPDAIILSLALSFIQSLVSIVI